MTQAIRQNRGTANRIPFWIITKAIRQGARMKSAAANALAVFLIGAIPLAGSAGDLLPCELTEFYELSVAIREHHPEMLEGLNEREQAWHDRFESAPGAWCASERTDPVIGRSCFAGYFDGMGNGIGIYPEPKWPGGWLVTFNGLWKNSPDGVQRYYVSAGGEAFETDAIRSPNLFANDAQSFKGFMRSDQERRLLADMWSNGEISFSTNDVLATVSTKGLEAALLHCQKFISDG